VALGLVLWPLSLCCPVRDQALWLMNAPCVFGRAAFERVPF